MIPPVFVRTEKRACARKTPTPLLHVIHAPQAKSVTASVAFHAPTIKRQTPTEAHVCHAPATKCQTETEPHANHAPGVKCQTVTTPDVNYV